MAGAVVALARSHIHKFSKDLCETSTLIEGVGVEKDAHAGKLVKHRSRVSTDPTKPNLRQVHLIHSELFAELAAKGFEVGPSDLGENICTSQIELLTLPRDTELHIGSTAIIRVTGIRNPCAQIEDFKPGLLKELALKRADGTIERKAGIMGVVERGGRIENGDEIKVILPPLPHHKLERV